MSASQCIKIVRRIILITPGSQRVKSGSNRSSLRIQPPLRAPTRLLQQAGRIGQIAFFAAMSGGSGSQDLPVNGRITISVYVFTYGHHK